MCVYMYVFVKHLLAEYMFGCLLNMSVWMEHILVGQCVCVCVWWLMCVAAVISMTVEEKEKTKDCTGPLMCVCVLEWWFVKSDDGGCKRKWTGMKMVRFSFPRSMDIFRCVKSDWWVVMVTRWKFCRLFMHDRCIHIGPATNPFVCVSWLLARTFVEFSHVRSLAECVCSLPLKTWINRYFDHMTGSKRNFYVSAGKHPAAADSFGVPLRGCNGKHSTWLSCLIRFQKPPI